MVERKKAGTDVGERPRLCRVFPKCSFDWLWMVTKDSLAVTLLLNYYKNDKNLKGIELNASNMYLKLLYTCILAQHRYY